MKIADLLIKLEGYNNQLEQVELQLQECASLSNSTTQSKLLYRDCQFLRNKISKFLVILKATPADDIIIDDIDMDLGSSGEELMSTIGATGKVLAGAYYLNQGLYKLMQRCVAIKDERFDLKELIKIIMLPDIIMPFKYHDDIEHMRAKISGHARFSKFQNYIIGSQNLYRLLFLIYGSNTNSQYQSTLESISRVSDLDFRSIFSSEKSLDIDGIDRLFSEFEVFVCEGKTPVRYDRLNMAANPNKFINIEINGKDIGLSNIKFNSKSDLNFAVDITTGELVFTGDVTRFLSMLATGVFHVYNLESYRGRAGDIAYFSKVVDKNTRLGIRLDPTQQVVLDSLSAATPESVSHYTKRGISSANSASSDFNPRLTSGASSTIDTVDIIEDSCLIKLIKKIDSIIAADLRRVKIKELTAQLKNEPVARVSIDQEEDIARKEISKLRAYNIVNIAEYWIKKFDLSTREERLRSYITRSYFSTLDKIQKKFQEQYHKAKESELFSSEANISDQIISDEKNDFDGIFEQFNAEKREILRQEQDKLDRSKRKQKTDERRSRKKQSRADKAKNKSQKQGRTQARAAAASSDDEDVFILDFDRALALKRALEKRMVAALGARIEEDKRKEIAAEITMTGTIGIKINEVCERHPTVILMRDLLNFINKVVAESSPETQLRIFDCEFNVVVANFINGNYVLLAQLLAIKPYRDYHQVYRVIAGIMDESIFVEARNYEQTELCTPLNLLLKLKLYATYLSYVSLNPHLQSMQKEKAALQFANFYNDVFKIRYPLIFAAYSDGELTDLRRGAILVYINDSFSSPRVEAIKRFFRRCIVSDDGINDLADMSDFMDCLRTASPGLMQANIRKLELAEEARLVAACGGTGAVSIVPAPESSVQHPELRLAPYTKETVRRISDTIKGILAATP